MCRGWGCGYDDFFSSDSLDLYFLRRADSLLANRRCTRYGSFDGHSMWRLRVLYAENLLDKERSRHTWIWPEIYLGDHRALKGARPASRTKNFRKCSRAMDPSWKQKTLGLKRQAARLRLPNLALCGRGLMASYVDDLRVLVITRISQPTKLPTGRHLYYSISGETEATDSILGPLQQTPDFQHTLDLFSLQNIFAL
jgi:hypothetical protein